MTSLSYAVNPFFTRSERQFSQQVSSFVFQAPSFFNPHLILELLKHQWDVWAKTPHKTKVLFLCSFDASCCSHSHPRCEPKDGVKWTLCTVWSPMGRWERSGLSHVWSWILGWGLPGLPVFYCIFIQYVRTQTGNFSLKLTISLAWFCFPTPCPVCLFRS